jgi:hypothetical protein
MDIIYQIDNIDIECLEEEHENICKETSKSAYKNVLNRRGPVQKYEIGWKEYYRINGYSKAYYREKERDKIICVICGVNTTKKSLNQHLRGKKCLKLSRALVVL